MYNWIVEAIRKHYRIEQDFIPLHAPVFLGRDKELVTETIESTFVSSVGKFVDEFELQLAQKTGSKYAICTVNGTAALHICLLLADVNKQDEVITQPFSFIATANAIHYTGASPIFIDIDKETLSLSPEKLEEFLAQNTYQKEGFCFNNKTNKRIKACVPMHTFGIPAKIESIQLICNKYNITLVEDAAESLGSYVNGKHTGNFGKVSAISFNGNKVITAGGGGAIITNDQNLAKRAKHITTTAKIPHKWAYEHDEVGYNYRMPNINAALALAQLEQLNSILENKQKTANFYQNLFSNSPIELAVSPENTTWNNWLNTIMFENKEQRDLFLDESNSAGIGSRPAWDLLSNAIMYKQFQRGDLTNAEHLADRVVNIPSSYNPYI
jgi:perosamine synthetase